MPEETVAVVEASTMHLGRTEGTVVLHDESGAVIPTQENMRLYSGTAIDTETESRAGVALDELKAATIGAESRAELRQQDKHLALTLEHGEMYFSVAKPLADDERFDISTSTMTMGVRGTSGYVAALSEEQCAVVLTSGHVTLEACGETQSVEPGECAVVTVSDGVASFRVVPIRCDQYPPLLLEELARDEAIFDEVSRAQAIPSADYFGAMDAYREVLLQADSYYFISRYAPEESGTYHYALAEIGGAEPAPVLLLSKTYGDGTIYARAFRFNAQTRAAYEVDGEGGVITIKLSDQSSTIPAMRSTSRVQTMPGRDGLWQLQAWGDGTLYIRQHTLENNMFIWKDTVYTGAAAGAPAELMGGIDVVWHDLAEAERLPGTGESALPTDGDRIVLTGTLNTYDYDAVLRLQGISDPNPGSSHDDEVYRLIVLDEPQTLPARNGDGSGSRERTVTMISVGYSSPFLSYGADIPAEYNGQHIIFSVDPETLSWPWDTSLPMGEPNTRDVHILS